MTLRRSTERPVWNNREAFGCARQVASGLGLGAAFAAFCNLLRSLKINNYINMINKLIRKIKPIRNQLDQEKQVIPYID